MAARKQGQLPRRLFKSRPIRRAPVPPGTEVVYEPAGMEKMSEVLEEFVEPFMDLADDESAYRKLLTLALLGWNAALLTQDQREIIITSTIKSSMSEVSPEDQALARELINLMVRRKEEHFADNKRMIVSFELTDLGHRYHLSVASTT